MAKQKTGRPVGKPPKNPPDDVKAIQDKIDLYFESLIEEDEEGNQTSKVPTYCGLALALDYASRQQLWEHSKANEPISLPIKRAMLRIEESYEQRLSSVACTGAIFALKNKGWTDKSEVEYSGYIGKPTAAERKARIAELEKKRANRE